jgi:opacity protein-like surface antigen
MRRSLLLSTAALGIAILPLGAAQAQGPTPFDNPGMYFGVDIGGASNSFDNDYEEIALPGSLDGVVGGFYLGYRFNRPPQRVWSFAIEGELNFFGNNDNCSTATVDESPDLVADCFVETDSSIELITPPEAPLPPDASADVLGYDMDWVARLRAIFGLPMENGMEPFFAIGAAWTRADIWDFEYQARGNFTGVTLGAGANIALAPHLYLRPEVLYDIYCPKDYQWGDEESDVLKVKLRTFTGRIGITYNF